MQKLLVLLAIFIAIISGGCTQYAYYQSPNHTQTNTYKAMPLHSEHKKSALYGGVSIAAGGANEDWKDGLFAFSGEIHQAHKFGVFQAFYGANVTLGNYQVNSYGQQYDGYLFGSYNRNLNDTLLNKLTGNKFFGTWGLSGGINVVQPFAKGGEWRIIGLEYSWQQEWGDYLSFRKQLPITAANLIDYKRNYSTLSITTDIIGKIDNSYLGYKIAMAITPYKLTYYNIASESSQVQPANFSQTLHFTTKRITGFVQANIGYYAGNFQLGMNYRLR
ncbi:MAG: hypothetical protein ACKVOW_08750 [Chitinophagaceae bacterium]